MVSTMRQGDGRRRGPEPLSREVTVVTPEATVLSLTLAGLGSRFTAVLLDALLQVALLGCLALLAGLPVLLTGGWPAVSRAAVQWLWPAVGLASGLVLFGYHALFESWWGGQTPGKRALGLRVTRLGGEPVGLTEAAVRNILRPIDALPLAVPPLAAPYLLGAAAAWSTSRRQRIGDLVAGTMVILERPTPRIEALLEGPPPSGPGPFVFQASQLGRLTVEDLELVDRFLRRREGLPLATRRRLAANLAQPLSERLGTGALPAGADLAEQWLVSLQLAWSARRRRW